MTGRVVGIGTHLAEPSGMRGSEGLVGKKYKQSIGLAVGAKERFPTFCIQSAVSTLLQRSMETQR